MIIINYDNNISYGRIIIFIRIVKYTIGSIKKYSGEDKLKDENKINWKNKKIKEYSRVNKAGNAENSGRCNNKSEIQEYFRN